MRFGLFHTVQWPEGSDQSRGYLEAIDEAVHADELGLGAVWLTEHHFSRHGVISDSLTVLAHIAARTRHIRLGTAVTVLPFHDPVRVAETAATVDVLSRGRLDFGVGRGYQWNEFNGFGLDITERAARFAESIDIILRSWGDCGPFEYEGRFWRYGRVDPQPKPVQRPHPPVWVATDNGEGFRECARADFGVLLRQGTSLRVLSNQMQEYRRVLAEEGKPFDPGKVAVARGLHVAETDAAAWEVVGSHYETFLEGAATAAAQPDGSRYRATDPFTPESLAEAVVFGSPQSCLRQLEAIRLLGIEYVLFFTRFGRLPHGEIMRSMDRFAAEVAPELRDPPLEPKAAAEEAVG